MLFEVHTAWEYIRSCDDQKRCYRNSWNQRCCAKFAARRRLKASACSTEVVASEIVEI
jgi:hypothetical protein